MNEILKEFIIRKNQFILYIKFLNESEYTLVGGLLSNSISIEKNPIETEDFSKDFKFYLSKSGVSSISIDGNGIIDDKLNKSFFKKMIAYVKDGIELDLILENSSLETIEGKFFMNGISFSDSHDQSTNFEFSLTSTGEYTLK